MDDLLTPYAGPAAIARNSTDRSKLCERIVAYFVRNRAIYATVEWQLTQFSKEELYKGLWNVCQKVPYKSRVKVSMRDGLLILKRM